MKLNYAIEFVADIIFFFALLLAFPGPILGQDFDAIDRSATEELSQLKIPGAAIAVIQGDRVVYSKAFGIANVETGERLRPEMLFRIGSTTKMFTATVLVGLAVQGKIDLNAPIGTHLAFLPPKLAAITANQLLSHTAGLHDEAPMYGSHDDSALGSGIRAWTDAWLFTPPGRVFSYSNPGYWCAGYLVETLASEPYADAMESRLFKPLGMERTTFRPTMAMTLPLAQGHEFENEKPKIARPAADNASGWPAGSIFSNTRDLARFVIAFLNGGVVDGKQVLDPKTISLIASPHAEVPGEGSYGYGLFIEKFRGADLLAHDGGRTGYASAIRMIPSQRVGVIILVNGGGEALPATMVKALEAAASLGPDDAKPKTPTAFTAPDLERIAGRYQNGKTRFELLVREGKLYLKQQDGSETELWKYGPSSFGATRPAFTVIASGTGKVDYLLNGDRAYARSN